VNRRMFCILLGAVVGLSAITPSPFCLSQNPQPMASTKKSASKPASSAPVATARGLYTETLAALLLDHDQKNAKNGFLKVVQIDAHFAAAWFNLGLIAESESSWIQAESYFHKYLAYAPNGPDAQRAKDQLIVLPKYASGEITPQTAKSAQYDALIQRSRVFLAAGHFREAIAEAGRAQAIDDSRWEAYAVVSLCMARQNKTQEAVQFASLAIDRAPADKRDQVRTALTSSDSPASIPTSSTGTLDPVPEQSGAVNSALTPQVNPERNETITSRSLAETTVASAQGIISDNDKVWLDASTNLIWLRFDYGSNLKWADAEAYCQSVHLAGAQDWRLAKIEELQALYSPSDNVEGKHIKGGIQTKGWIWSSETGLKPDEIWVQYFGNGIKYSIKKNWGKGKTALCTAGNVGYLRDLQGDQSHFQTKGARNASTVESPVAILHVFRNESREGWEPYIFVDEQRTLPVLNHQNVKMILPPGKHAISVQGKGITGSQMSNLFMEAGKEYWIKLTVSFGLMQPKTSLTVMSSQDGQAEATKLVQINFGDAFKN
jgi:tetratricopeptide (TPR) repeat protein